MWKVQVHELIMESEYHIIAPDEGGQLYGEMLKVRDVQMPLPVIKLCSLSI